MEKKIEEGCLAIVVRCDIPSFTKNIGKLVTVGKFLGEVPTFIGKDRWEVSQLMESTLGIPVFHQRERNLHRIDEPDESIQKDEVVEVQKGQKVTI